MHSSDQSCPREGIAGFALQRAFSGAVALLGAALILPTNEQRPVSRTANGVHI
jgi:hypothetical protein